MRVLYTFILDRVTTGGGRGSSIYQGAVIFSKTECEILVGILEFSAFSDASLPLDEASSALFGRFGFKADEQLNNHETKIKFQIKEH